MKKTTAVILSVIIAMLGTFFDFKDVAFASDSAENSINVTVENYSIVNYFSFSNPYKIATGESYIAVLDRTDDNQSRLLVFSKEGKQLTEKTFSNAKDIEIMGDDCFVLDWSLKTNESFVYDINLVSGRSDKVIAEAVYDLSSNDGYLYCLTGALSKEVKRFSFTDVKDITGKVTNRYFLEDKDYTVGDSFRNVSTFTVSDDFLFGLQTMSGESSVIVTTKSGSPVSEISNIPESISELLFFSGSIYYINPKGIFVGGITSTSALSQLISSTPNGISSSKNLISPVSFSFVQSIDEESGELTCDGSVYVLDKTNANAVKGFDLKDGVLTPKPFIIASYSFDNGAMNSPSDLVSANGSTYFADSKNYRVTVKANGVSVKSFDVLDTEGNLLSPTSVCVTPSGDIIVATKQKVLRYSQGFALLDEYASASGTPFTDVTACVSSDFSSDLYLIDNGFAVKFAEGNNSFERVSKSLVKSGSAFVDFRSETMFIADGNKVHAYSLVDFSKRYEILLPNGTDIAMDTVTDFSGNLFVLSKTADGNVLYRYFIEAGTPAYNNKITLLLNGDATFSRIAFDSFTQTARLISDNDNRPYYIGKSAFSRLGVIYHSSLVVPVDIFDNQSDNTVRIGTITDGNRIFYPVNKSDPLCPDGEYSNESVKKLPKGEQLIVVGSTSDGKTAYVIYDKVAGFMDFSTISVPDQGEDLPYEDGVALHEGVYLYKYPVLDLDENNLPLFAVSRLSKDAPITVLNKACDYLSDGLYWYYVSYVDQSGNTLYGYIPRFNTVKRDTTPQVAIEYGRIEADILQGYVDVYADDKGNLLGKTLLDKTRIIILDDSSEEYYYVREYDGENPVEGYVLKSCVTRDSETQSTIVALILIGILIAVTVILLIIKTIVSSHKRKRVGY